MHKEIKISYQYFESLDLLNDTEKKLFDKAKQARLQAYAPYSEFLVGCALLLDNGEIVVGNNQENAAYPSGLCAERTAIFWASANFPNRKILKLFVIGGSEKNPQNRNVVTPPCGACRQSILEYESKQSEPIEIYFASVNGEVCKVQSIKDLLPFNFDSKYL